MQEQEQEALKQRSSNALKSGVWYTVSSVSVKAVLLITTPIFTRLMSTADFGVSATFTTWFALLNVICSLNLWYSIGRAKIDFPQKLEEFVGAIQLLAFMFVMVVGCGAFFFIDRVCKLLELDVPLVVALFVYLLAYPSVQLTQAKFKYLYKYKENIAITIYTTISTVLFSLIMVFILPDQKALGKSLGAVISASLLAIIVWVYALKNGLIKIKTEYWKYALKISVPLILNSVALNILAQADRIFITKYCGTDYTGIYSLAYSYAVLINIVLNAVNEAWLPWFHDTLNDRMVESIRKNVKPLIFFGCWFGIVCIALAPEAIAILGGKSYREGIWVVPPVTLGIVCGYIFQHYEHIELHLKKTWYISMGTVMAAIINIGLNYVFVQMFGFVAAAYTTLFCYCLLMILHHFISRVVLKVHLYDDKFMYLAVIGTCLLGALFMSLYNTEWWWRWGGIAIISLTYIYINRILFVAIFNRFFRKKESFVERNIVNEK